GAEDVGQRLDLGQVVGREDQGVGVDVGQRDAVDADRGAGAGVVRVARRDVVGQVEPVPDGPAGGDALARAVQVVPVVEQAAVDPGGRDGAAERGLRLDGPQ